MTPMKRICFPATNRVHLSRQKLLLDELSKYFEVDIFEPQKQEGNMSVSSILYAIEFNNFLNNKQYDCALVRGDRYEMLGLAMCAAYRRIPIAHIEGGDLSSVIDNRVRHAVTHLSDFHFCTNEESHARLISMGISPTKVWNYGSLDVEFAKNVPSRRLKGKKYILVAYHPIEGENEEEVSRAIEDLNLMQRTDINNDAEQGGSYEIVNIASNSDYGRQYGSENYSPENYISLMTFAKCCVGNSSSFLKEASILGTPVVNVGSRQDKRLKPKNVLDVPCEKEKILKALLFQTSTHYQPDEIYFQPNTSENIARKLSEII